MLGRLTGQHGTAISARAALSAELTAGVPLGGGFFPRPLAIASIFITKSKYLVKATAQVNHSG